MKKSVLALLILGTPVLASADPLSGILNDSSVATVCQSSLEDYRSAQKGYDNCLRSRGGKPSFKQKACLRYKEAKDTEYDKFHDCRVAAAAREMRDAVAKLDR